MSWRYKISWLWTIPIAAALGGGLVVLGAFLGADVTSLTGPLLAVSQWLRSLSLSGAGGNIMAWAILLAVSALPALGLLCRGRRWGDLLLLLSGVEVFAGLYFQINPFLLHGELPMDEAWALAWMGTAAATLVAWGVLRLLNRREEMGNSLGRLLVAAAVFVTFFTTAVLTSGHMAELEATAAANVNSGFTETATHFILRLLWVMDVHIAAATGYLLLAGSELVRVLDRNPFSHEAVSAADYVSTQCRRVTALSLLVCVAGNVLQMAFFSRTRSVSVMVELPMGLILLSLCLTLLCRYFRRAKAVSDDNASII